MKEKEKEALFMKTVEAIRNSEMASVRAMQQYVDEKKRQAREQPEDAKREARRALERTGVTTSSGNLKTVIVSWE